MARNLGQETEKRILKKIGARRQPASGAIPGFPNDGVIGKYLIEVKSTQRGSLGLKRKWLEDLEENAIMRGKIPTLVVVFNEVVGTSGPLTSWAMREWIAIPRRDFKRLTKNWQRT